MKSDKTMKSNYNILKGCLFFVYVLLVACYPNEPENVEDFDLVYTNYAPEFTFQDQYTYSLPDGVIKLDDDTDENEPPEFIDTNFSDAIISKIRENLNAKGWQEVNENQNPDIVVLPSAFNQNFLYYYNPGYWGWYYPGCFPGWGWYYPGYSPGYVSGFKTGTVLIQMTSANDIQDVQVPVIWLGALNGLLQGSDSYTISRIDNGIDQAFTHAPFN
ncbi:DUF4136 domain-containing protein [Mesonia aquimarina]|uniref:DUF4136 domain-containing protein n=1 Tax=Mesonia aquimarina TaxID=1504967 RepID=UPI000EF6312A|nr:DUF4136 domain-containing protein [Mesonia aquimarina]